MDTVACNITSIITMEEALGKWWMCWLQINRVENVVTDAVEKV